MMFLSFIPLVSAQICTDRDGDGYAAEGGPCGEVDCDDNDPAIHPGAIEICDGKDSDCDGWTALTDVDSDGDGVPLCASDCDDDDPATYPGAQELCDGLDNDCNWYIPFSERDFDNDGVRLCDAPADCNDYDADIFPGNYEYSGDLKDNDCNGATDEPQSICPDRDGDGFTDLFCGGEDCDDSDPAAYPGAVEVCDGKDSDCDGQVPADDTDGDGDGFPLCAGDCDDSDAAIFPTDPGICDSELDDCSRTLTMRWSAPTTNMDGSPLLDLSGYKFYFRQSAYDYSDLIDIGDITCHAITNLSQGIWCFVVTAYDTTGNESEFSNEVCTSIQ